MTDKELCEGISIIEDLSDGARSKYWVIKEGKKFLLKVNKVHPGGELTKENVSEYLAMLIAKELGIPCVNIILSESAILSEVMYDEVIHSFIEYSEEFSHSFHLSNLTTFDISTLLNPKHNIYVSEVVQMLLFDILIGNSDRHPGNFGYTVKGFYPLFDNGSSLLAYVKEVDIDSYLNNSDRFNSLVYTKSKPVLRVGQKLKHYELLSILKDSHSVEFRNFAERLHSLNFHDMLESLPITDKRKLLLEKFLNTRKAWFYE